MIYGNEINEFSSGWHCVPETEFSEPYWDCVMSSNELSTIVMTVRWRIKFLARKKNPFDDKWY